MVNPYIGWVNLQMVSVRHHLSLLVEENNANDRLRNRGVLESAVWHLARAYHYYLFELGSNYQLKAPEDNQSAQALADSLEAADKHPGEAAELLNLEANGWLGDLLSAVPSLGAVQETRESQLPGDISIVDPEAEEEIEISSELANEWLAKFKELTTRHREVMIEY